MGPITVLLAEDHTIVRQGLRTLLDAETDIEVVGEAENGQQAVLLAKKLRPEVVVIDMAMPTLNGMEATRQILKALPTTRVLVLSAHSDDDYIDQAIEMGASGYLIKESSAQVLSRAIREVQKGKKFFSPSISRRLEDQQEKLLDMGGTLGSNKKKLNLSSREVEVIQLISEGKSNKEISTALDISIKTVEKHRQHIMDKLNIHNTAGLTRYAISKGIIEDTNKIKLM